MPPHYALRMPLTRAEQNDLWVRLAKGGLNPADCVLSEDQNRVKPLFAAKYILDHKPTGSRLTIYGPYGDNTWRGHRQVGTDAMRRMRSRQWPDFLDAVQTWADKVAEWQQTPDLWAMGAERLPEADENSPFTAGEREEIAKALADIKSYVRANFGLAAEQMRAIEESLDYLKEAAEHTGRKDWRLLLYGTLVSVAVERAVSSSVVQAMFTMAVHALGHIFGVASPPPMISA
jgi:hypothetical protein